MNALILLALVPEAPAPNSIWLINGWDPIPWFWLILGIVMVAGFFLLAFRRSDLPHDDANPRGQNDREVYP
jgi:hypothetical protein